MSEKILDYDKRIRSCTIDYLDLTGKTYFMNNEGTYIEQEKLNVWSRLLATATEAGIFTYSREEVGSTAGYEVFDIETPEKVAERTAKRAIEQLKAKPPKGGTYPVILGPNQLLNFINNQYLKVYCLLPALQYYLEGWFLPL